MAPKLLTLLFPLLVAGMIGFSRSARITIVNNCKETIWPGITGMNSTGDGFPLKPTQSSVFSAPADWNGRVWARTACNFDSRGNGTCLTGGCGHSLKCAGPGQPPASIAEFGLGGDLDYYDVSLVDGFNVPVVVRPINGRGKCSPVGCYDDLRPNCPGELAMNSSVDGKTVIACRSACTVFDTDEYCCRGAFSTPMACAPTNYSRIFKQGCPAAYSFAYDDPTSIITCSATDYVVTFCSSRNETQCTYHDNRLVCDRGGAARAAVAVWEVVVTAVICLTAIL
ncbi:pathogenesis-related thaumatin-like protein 3.5 [Andrographis paniculata]|uniref:pathogenesis-related thaumatin-like protein 3.5 n=1 Tax=Andrographis paniculata TaxID=175694 RepID=UPI0021E8681C|nr:pathogenesis-related thaumatin-like protein 3.5 [Andrographis paniculata]